jgi:ribosomal protein S27E
MTSLADVIVGGRLLEIRCTDCHAKTPIDPAFFHRRRGDIELNALRLTLVCPGCGCRQIGLEMIAPLKDKEEV